jgi:FlaG/FlaF family flagellin (archaellin)
MAAKETLRRFLNDKRGLTPIISELLLVVIAVSAMSIATSATYVITTNMRENMSERVVAEDVWFNTASSVSVYVYNVGKVDVSFTQAYVNHESVTFNAPQKLETNQSYALTVNHVWTSGEVYYIDIVTARGLHVAGYYQAP